jgi:hypothetical protein
VELSFRESLSTQEMAVLTFTTAAAQVPVAGAAKGPSSLVARNTRYPVIAEPFVAGATHVTVMSVVLPFAVGGAGVSGGPIGVTPADVTKLLRPASLRAATWKKYCVPLSRPVALQVVLVDVDIRLDAHVPFGAVHGPVMLVPTLITYPSNGAPPVTAGAVQFNDT